MNKKKIAVIGGGPAGFSAAVNAAENAGNNTCIDIYEKSVPLKTVLYTGNGRCNLSNNISDFRELAGNYPRGEKFLYSVFSRFGVPETLEWFYIRGLKTYVQKDNRIFPKTDKAATVRELFLKKTAELGITIVKAGVKDVSANNKKFIVNSNNGSAEYDVIIISTGGSRKDSACGYSFAKKLGHNITELKPSLTSLTTEEKWVKNLAGVSIKNSQVQSFFNKKKISDIMGDFVFTHNGLTGPAVFNTSSYCAFLGYSPQNPLILKINFVPAINYEELKEDLLEETNKTRDKSISNILKKYIPKSLTSKLLAANNINPDKKSASVNIKEMEIILKILLETEIKIVSPTKEGEIITAGGVDLKQINSRTMESKLVKNLFFCGEVLDIDGLTGGFNLQMCWSTGYLAGINSVKQEN